MRLAALLPCAGCAAGWTQSLTVGGTFTDEHAALVVALEVTPMVHEPFEAPPSSPDPNRPIMPDPHGPPRYLGIGATASVGALWGPTLGATTFAAVGIDYFSRGYGARFPSVTSRDPRSPSASCCAVSWASTAAAPVRR